jgi:hypothetical protein
LYPSRGDTPNAEAIVNKLSTVFAVGVAGLLFPLAARAQQVAAQAEGTRSAAATQNVPLRRSEPKPTSSAPSDGFAWSFRVASVSIRISWT